MHRVMMHNSSLAMQYHIGLFSGQASHLNIWALWYSSSDIRKQNVERSETLPHYASWTDWDAISSSIIKHCWDHTRIQSDDDPTPNPLPVASTSAWTDLTAWKIIQDFVTSENSPQGASWGPLCGQQLEACTGSNNAAEGNVTMALDAINLPPPFFPGSPSRFVLDQQTLHRLWCFSTTWWNL